MPVELLVREFPSYLDLTQGRAMGNILSFQKIGFISSFSLHLILIFGTTLHHYKDKPSATIVPIGLKIIPVIETKDEIVPVVTPKKKKVIKVVKKQKEHKVVKKVKPIGKKDGRIVSLKERYLYELKMLVENNKVYPKRAKRLKQQGSVVVHFTIGSDGVFKEFKLAKSSSFRTLDSGAIKLLKKLASFKPIPEELNVSSLSVSQTITYQMD